MMQCLFQDSTVSKMSREIEALKRELREKDKHLASANAKVRIHNTCCSARDRHLGNYHRGKIIQHLL